MVTVRMWTKDGYHKDVALLDERQLHMHEGDAEPKGRHIIAGPSKRKSGVVILLEDYPEANEFEVIVT